MAIFLLSSPVSLKDIIKTLRIVLLHSLRLVFWVWPQLKWRVSFEDVVPVFVFYHLLKQLLLFIVVQRKLMVHEQLTLVHDDTHFS